MTEMHQINSRYTSRKATIRRMTERRPLALRTPTAERPPHELFTNSNDRPPIRISVEPTTRQESSQLGDQIIGPVPDGMISLAPTG
jgi:hypothetical protein